MSVISAGSRTRGAPKVLSASTREAVLTFDPGDAE
jgi:hypothetical protein